MDLGAHSRDLAGPEFTTVFPGFQTPTDRPASFNAMAWTLQNQVLRGSVLSHTSAALLWGIPLPAQVEHGVSFLRHEAVVLADGATLIPSLKPDRSLRTGATLPVLHCRVERDGSSSVGRGARVHRWVPGPTATIDGLVVSSPAEVLRELATILPLGDLVAAIDALIGPRSPCPDLRSETVAEHAEAMRRRQGSHQLLRALALAREDVRSPGETLMRLLISFAGFPEPVPNLLVRDPTTGAPRYLDLAWEQASFVLEYDGDGHRTTKEQWRDDEARRDELASYGWTIARATAADIARPLRILLRLGRSLRERGVPAPSPEDIRRFVATLPGRNLSLQIARRQPSA